MIYRAYPADTSKLLAMPETGMGYQLIQATTLDRSLRYIAYNAELIVNLDQGLNEAYTHIRRDYAMALHEATSFPGLTESITLLPKNLIVETQTFASTASTNKNRHSGGKGAKDNPLVFANGSDVFVRLSAYEDDKRVDMKNGRLIPGTYATTDGDYADCVQYNDDPVDRYALPNSEAIKWAFFVRPQKTDKLRRGIVQPAFGQTGGGLEVLFDDGTSYRTLFDKREYGK